MIRPARSRVDERVGIGGRAPGTQLRYTGSAPSFISARSTTGFELHRLGVFYTNSAFTRAIVDLSHAANSDSALALVSDCVFAAGSSQLTAAAIIDLDQVIISTIRNCSMSGARAAISGVASSDHYANAIQIQSCQFKDTAAAPIQNPGSSWLIEGCTFEPRHDASAGAVACAYRAQSLSIIGCWMGDVGSSGPSAWISFLGEALLVEGNMIGGSPNTTAIAIVGSDNAGVEIRANRFDTHAKAVDLGTGLSAAMIVDNVFHNVATPVLGAVPANAILHNDNGFGIGVRPLSALHVNGAVTVGRTISATAGAGQILPTRRRRPRCATPSALTERDGRPGSPRTSRAKASAASSTWSPSRTTATLGSGS